jgi:hypothetical protein
MLAYLKTLAAPAPPEPLRGNAENGAKVFLARCARPAIRSTPGRRLGPDLPRIGSARSRDVPLARLPRLGKIFAPASRRSR